MLAGALAVFVSEKFTVVSPVAPAVTVYGPPAVAFAVNGADATPDAFVATTIVPVLLLNTPEAPSPEEHTSELQSQSKLVSPLLPVTTNPLAKALLTVAG